MSNILIVIKEGIIQEIKSDGLDDKIIFADYDLDPDLDISDEKVFRPTNRLTEEEINLFKNY